MATLDFKIEGLEHLKNLNKKIQQQVDLASRNGVNKAADLIAYGRTTAVNAKNVKPTSAVGRAARILMIPTEHIFYRTFIKNIKVSVGSKGAKPYASVMMRGNDINVVDLLLKGNEAKTMYGFKSRKRSISGKVKPNMKGKAAAARMGGGKVKIAGKVYNKSYLADGSYRNKSDKINRYYMDKLGAKANKLAGSRFLLFQRKDSGQKLPYPSKVVKINKRKVISALSNAADSAISRYGKDIQRLQTEEVQKRLKKLKIRI